MTDTDFRRVIVKFDRFTTETRWDRAVGRQLPPNGWEGAKISHVLRHPSLDLKPRRLMPAALRNLECLNDHENVMLADIADVLLDTKSVVSLGDVGKMWRVVAGQDIRAVEGIVTPSAPARAWKIAEQKGEAVFTLRDRDIIVGLVRPERRNIGLLLDEDGDVVGIPDGIAVVRVKSEFAREYPQGWLFATLRSEACRLQFWTESGGTSYGKLNDAHIQRIVVPTLSPQERDDVARNVENWAASVRVSISKWTAIGCPADRRPIINSSGFGLLEDVDDGLSDDADE